MLPGLTETTPRTGSRCGWGTARPARFAAGARPLARQPDVIYAFGHGHIGMTSAPMTGKLVAELVSGAPTSADVAPFSAARFLLD